MPSDVTEKINEYAHYCYGCSPASCGPEDMKWIELDIPVHIKNKSNYYQTKEKNIDTIAPELHKVKHAIQNLTFTRNIISERAGWTIKIDKEIEVCKYPANEKVIEKQNQIIREYNKVRNIFFEKLEKYNKRYGRSKNLNMPKVDIDFKNYENAPTSKVAPLFNICFAVGEQAEIIKRAEPETFFKIFKILQNIYQIAIN